MSKWLRFCRKGLIFGVACGLAMIAFAGHAARAGNVALTITEDGLAPVTLDFLSPLAQMGGDMNHVTANDAALNATLTGLGYDFNVFGLTAVANAPGLGGTATLFTSGLVERVGGGGNPGGIATLQIDGSQNDYATLATLAGHMSTTFSANFTNTVAGNTQSSTSYFSSTNAQNDTTGPNASSLFNSTGPAPNGGTATPGTDVPSTMVFSLTNRDVITLSPDLSGGLTPPTDQFTHATLVSSAIPEPASIAMMGMGLPVVIVGLGWLRRRRAAA